MDESRRRGHRRPAGFDVVATSAGAPVAAFEDRARRLAGVQYHPEVLHSPHGQQVLSRFLHEIAGIGATWTAANIAESLIEQVRNQIGHGQAICGLSGGVDSAVAAALVQRAIGDRLTCVFVDHGLLRAGEREQVQHDFVAATGAKLVTVDAVDNVPRRARRRDRPRGQAQDHRPRVHPRFEGAVRRRRRGRRGRRRRDVEFLVQGTLYPDVVESGGGSGTANIKSHHNVGGLPEDLEFELVEPLRLLFKDEVRAVGRELGLPEEIVGRQPFPGPGLAIRIVGEVTAAGSRRCGTPTRSPARNSPRPVSTSRSGSARWCCSPTCGVGVQGDGRTYGHPIVLRPVSSEDAMTADWTRLPYDVLERISTRITNEVPEVNRVVLDVTSKPPGTIEWE